MRVYCWDLSKASPWWPSWLSWSQSYMPGAFENALDTINSLVLPNIVAIALLAQTTIETLELRSWTKQEHRVR